MLVLLVCVTFRNADTAAVRRCELTLSRFPPEEVAQYQAILALQQLAYVDRQMGVSTYWYRDYLRQLHEDATYRHRCWTELQTAHLWCKEVTQCKASGIPRSQVVQQLAAWTDGLKKTLSDDTAWTFGEMPYYGGLYQLPR